MPEADAPSLPALIAQTVKRQIFALQDYSLVTARSVACIFTPPRYTADLLGQMDDVGVGSLPIVLLTGFFIGAVLVLQTATQFERFGETALTGDAVAISIVRELGPSITSLLVAGRNASGMASELGSMVVTEQVDAMRALGTDPYRKLATPRLLATVLTLPLLTALSDFAGLIGGFIMSNYQLHSSASQFWNRAIHALVFGDIVQGMVKPLVFGFIIATVGVYKGLRVRGGTQGVGRATTAAVVTASVWILVSNFFITRFMLWVFAK